MERGSKVGILRKRPLYELSLGPCPQAGERGQERTQAKLSSPFSPSQLAETKKEKLRMSGLKVNIRLKGKVCPLL
jgi:hypothetical protein